MLIAVIDSGIDQSDVMLRGIQIKSKTVELHHKNKHGTNIVKIIVRDNLIEQFKYFYYIHACYYNLVNRRTGNIQRFN